jgi:hypothetical protein
MIPDHDVEFSAGQDEPSERPEDLRMSLRNRLEPLDAGGNDPAGAHSRIESGQIEHVAQDDESNPGAHDSQLPLEVLDEPREYGRRAMLVRGRARVLRQMEVTDNDDDLAAGDRYVRVPPGPPTPSSIRSSSHRRAADPSQFATEKTKVGGNGGGTHRFGAVQGRRQ